MIPISDVVARGLCCGCGTCAGVCPTQAIRMKASEGLFLPGLTEGLCNNCMLCSKSCPGASVDFEAFQKKIFGQAPELASVGNYSDCYLGYSNDENIRYDSSSGGLVTQLLIFALENKIIDGAVVTRMKRTNPLEPESFIARSVEEILDASRSKYCPVETNSCLKMILKEKGRFAVVGLPCHIHGIRKAETILRPLEKKIVLHLGLLCSHTVDFAGIYLLLKKLGIEKDEVKSMSYRGGGWPGFLSVETQGDKKKRLPLVGSWKAYWPLFSSFFFTPMRCTMCPDQTAEVADISFGDAWLPELKHDKSGTSIIISRTGAGKSLLDRASNAKSITLIPVGVEKVLQSQFTNLRFKKDDLNSRLSLLRKMGKDTPTFRLGSAPSRSPLSATLRSMYIYSSIKASSQGFGRYFLQRTPFPFIRLYYGIYKSLCKI